MERAGPLWPRDGCCLGWSPRGEEGAGGQEQEEFYRARRVWIGRVLGSAFLARGLWMASECAAAGAVAAAVWCLAAALQVV